jgi:hypothetical protein
MGRKPKTRRAPYGARLLHLTWAYWERTGKFVGRETIIKTAKALGVSVQTLLRLDK